MTEIKKLIEFVSNIESSLSPEEMTLYMKELKRVINCVKSVENEDFKKLIVLQLQLKLNKEQL